MRLLVKVLVSVAFALGSEGLLAPIANGFLMGPQAPAEVKISVIDREKANELFSEFLKHTEIPFKYPLEGCYARATVMSKIAESEGVQTGRVYVQGLLQVKTDLPRFPKVNWGWHVAPLVYVNQPSGPPVLMVLDPSLFDRPVTVKEWTNRMLDTTGGFEPKIEKVYYGDRFQFYGSDFDAYKSEWQPSDLAEANATISAYSRLLDLTKDAKSGVVAPSANPQPHEKAAQ